MHFSAARFDAHGRKHGHEALWESARDCPCEGVKSARPSILCPRCAGWGFFFADPVDLFLPAMSDNKKLIEERFGSYVYGDLSATFPTLSEAGTRVLVGSMDRVFFPTRALVLRDILTRRATDPDGSTLERIWFPSVRRVLSCATLTENFIQGEDYELTPDGGGNRIIINWIAGMNAPENGERYSITVEAAPFYAVISTKYRSEDDARMPQFSQLRMIASARHLAAIGDAIAATAGAAD